MQQNGKTSQNNTSQGYNPPLIFRTARATLYVLIKALNIVYVPIFIYRVFEKSEKCSPVTDPVLRIPASELVGKIRRKEVRNENIYLLRLAFELNQVLK